MFRTLRRTKGQSTLEYAILIVVVIIALIGIQGYISRAVQGRGRDSADQIGSQFEAGTGSFNYTTTTSATVKEKADAWTTTTDYVNQTSNRSGWETVGNFETISYY